MERQEQEKNVSPTFPKDKALRRGEIHLAHLGQHLHDSNCLDHPSLSFKMLLPLSFMPAEYVTSGKNKYLPLKCAYK